MTKKSLWPLRSSNFSKTARIVFTGGGTAGHVIPNIVLIEKLGQEGWDINYIGSQDGVEKQMLQALKIPYYGIPSGKLRRYFSWQNFVDPLNILRGIIHSFWLLRKLKPHVVFSKGGFVAFPVVVGAWLNRLPIIAHESDLSPGLANRLSFPFVNKICVTFEGGKGYFKNPEKVEITGTPIRSSLYEGSKEKGLALCHFVESKPRILVMGGSQGSSALNNIVRQSLNVLSQNYQIIHLCGKGKIDKNLSKNTSYFQIEYADDELPDLLAASDIIISRSGANSLYEILVLKKPHLLIPLSTKVSRGEQLQNAMYFQKQGISEVIQEKDLNPQLFFKAIQMVEHQGLNIIEKIKGLKIEPGTSKILNIIKSYRAKIQ